ncbi:MAG: transporter substrate-binding domain-containing protein [Acidimicrobiia bacterium]|nr:transporter substrate-binding domain-containing protein [Acidimicrobiia bacterium]
MKRFSYALSALLGMALFASACGGGDALVLCTDAPYPPMEMEIDGEFTGFDIELMRAIADELGRELEVNNIGFDPITSGLAMESGECEIAAASITITAEREENIDFSDPYFTADQSLLVGTASGITNLAGFAGRNLGVQTGTTGEMYANANAPGDATIISFENPGDIFTALAAGEIEGVLQDIVPNADYVLNNPDDAELVETYPTDESYGFAVAEEGSEDLLNDVNEALATLRENGTYDDIYDDWF